MKKLTALFIGVLCTCSLLTGLTGCGNDDGGQQIPEESPVVSTDKKPDAQLYLVKGDTYNFGAVGSEVIKTDSSAVSATGNVIKAVKRGSARVTVKNDVGKELLYKITIAETAMDTEGKFNIDKGMISGKNIIVFGDSITDGHMGAVTSRYSETYFALLSNYLDAASDATDLTNTNFARSGTTITYGLRRNFGISGVERVDMQNAFTEHDGTERYPYGNVSEAELCIIYYGTNDFTEDVYKDNSKKTQYTDSPYSASQAKTIKGGLYYMINKLYDINPSLKILVLPPIYRRAEGNHLIYAEDDKNEIINSVTGEKLSEYGEVMQEVCEELGAKFINWYSVFDYENFGKTNEFTDDGLHPNAKGHKKMFDYIVENL